MAPIGEACARLSGNTSVVVSVVNSKTSRTRIGEWKILTRTQTIVRHGWRLLSQKRGEGRESAGDRYLEECMLSPGLLSRGHHRKVVFSRDAPQVRSEAFQIECCTRGFVGDIWSVAAAANAIDLSRPGEP